MKCCLLGIAAIIGALFLISCTANKGTFTLVNKSIEPIARASVAICGQTIELRAIQPDTSGTGSYEVKCEGHYSILVEFQSGKTLQKETGYVTPGMDFQHEIAVTSSDIEITQQPTNSTQ